MSSQISELFIFHYFTFPTSTLLNKYIKGSLSEEHKSNPKNSEKKKISKVYYAFLIPETTCTLQTWFALFFPLPNLPGSLYFHFQWPPGPCSQCDPQFHISAAEILQNSLLPFDFPTFKKYGIPAVDVQQGDLPQHHQCDEEDLYFSSPKTTGVY